MNSILRKSLNKKKLLQILILYVMPALLLPKIIFAQDLKDHVVQIIITSQHYDYYSPWKKGPVRKTTIQGTVIMNNMILTKASPLADHLLIEIQKHGSKKKYPAGILVRDYFSGLALLEIKDKTFFSDLKPAPLAEPEKLVGIKGIIARWDTQGNYKEYSAATYNSAMVRISNALYDSYYYFLAHNMTTGMNGGGNGEPFFVKGRLAGITFNYNEKKRTVQVCSIESVKRFLKDMSGGHYKGTPFFKIDYMPIESDINLRRYLGLTSDDTGIYVHAIHPLSSGSKELKSGDVILEINGNRIDDSGMYNSKYYGKLHFSGLLYTDSFIGDTVKMTVFRKRKKISLRFKLLPVRPKMMIVPEISVDEQPEYFIFGGLIFQKLSRGFLNLWGANWKTRANKRFLFYYYKSKMENPRRGKAYVILNRVLPAPVNKGYRNRRSMILKSINNINIKNIAHAFKLIKNSGNRFIKFDFIGGVSIVLEKKKAKKSLNRILLKYNIDKASFISEAKKSE